MKKQQSGFTLIELIMVIVILGILAAFALPKFADLSSDAKKASLSGLAGSLKSASAIARSSQLAAGVTLGTAVNLDGANVVMVNGYPQALATGGISAAVGIVDTSDYTATGGAAAGGSTVTYQLTGKLSATCQVTYRAATAAADNTAPITAAPVVTITNSGC
ncbi:type II secretion system protein [Aquipseudomonas ullengensis]|uniref:Prepilin-type N-terminal cleavage/methylation domain-containing protein n=1 Tax=Aquipseudomonas ullengensis TaxID=2759166 RepID=A0A7W4LP82_9GAMM|nr:prepilin-type N-terminal cleavage/methylation domain-containing protein [Pseudomonas ullengensis]MBB2496796.1 prepilin-type N-terminal cleavage/methylation domain-containing protein [Pseudomonas ullengensis]